MYFFKSLAISFAFLCCSIFLYGQQDPSLSDPIINPDPLIVNEEGVLTFTFNNGDVIPNGSDIAVAIFLTNIDPIGDELAVSGSAAGLFSWSFNNSSTTPFLYGTQILEIGAVFSGEISVEFNLIDSPMPEDLSYGFNAVILNNPIDEDLTNNQVTLFTGAFPHCAGDGPRTNDTCEGAFVQTYYGPVTDCGFLFFEGAVDELSTNNCGCGPNCVAIEYDLWQSFYPDENGEILIIIPDELDFEIYDACGGNILSCSSVGSLYTGLDPAGLYYLRYWPSSGSNCEPTAGLCLFQPLAIPVELTKFEVENQGKYNELRWTSLSEINSIHYEIQRSSNHNTFVSLDKIEIAGNTVTEKNYQYLDKTPLVENYYRLKIVDYNGDIEFSDVVHIRNEKSNSVEAYPNPAFDKLYISGVTNGEEIIVYNAQGDKIKRIRYMESMDLSGLTSGLYHIHILGNNSWVKFMKY